MSLQTTQQQISTGLMVNSAADNAATWSIAQTMSSDQNVYTQLSSNLSQTDSQLNVATAAVNSAITVMNSIKTALTQAEAPGADTAAIATSIAQLSSQLTTIVNSASFNGVNLLNGSQDSSSATPTLNVTASYVDGQTSLTSGGSATDSTVGTISVQLQTLIGNPSATGATSVAGSGILDGGAVSQGPGSLLPTAFTALTTQASAQAVLDNTTAGGATGAGGTTGTTLTDTLNNADQVINDLTTYAATLGAAQSRVESQNSFLQTLNSALTTGIGALVDADMNQASTRLQALQTQQQLGVQSLSIANQNSQMILKLFQ